MYSHKTLFAALVFTLAAMLALTNAASAALTAKDVYPDTPDPLVGDWQGRWTQGEKVDPAISAQIIALGKDEYRIILASKLDMRCPPRLVVEVTKSGGGLKFEMADHYGEVKGDSFTGGRSGGKAIFEMKKVSRLSPALGTEPPEGAVILFDGSDLDQWQEPKGWEILDGGVMMSSPKSKTLVSKRKFTDAKIHAEFRTPFMPRARGQQRGNSGLFVQGTYEVQILDSYGLEGYYNECGALYKVSAPHVNACAPPLQWQTYDITYSAPRFDQAGKLTENARMTVLHNGVLIHNDQELWWLTAWTEVERKGAPPSEPGSMTLQVHGNFMQFRNIWVVDLAAGGGS